MFKDLPLFPEQASGIAREVDALYFALVGISLFFASLIAGLVIYFAIKYRRRSEEEIPEPIVGSHSLELTWSAVPFLISMGIFLWGADIFYTMSRPPAGSLDVYAVGKQWMWKFQHPTGQREIDELHVPVGRPIKLTLASEDVIHSFFVPAFRVKADAVPGRFRTAWFEATKTGSYHLFCAEYCGTRHAGMIGKLVVMEPAEYENWLSGGLRQVSPAAGGEKLFVQLACNTCHRVDESGRGPSLIGLFGKQVTMQNGEVLTAEESYLRESILNPQARIVTGYQPIMPTFQGLINEEGLLQMIAYIKSLKGTTPGEMNQEEGETK